VVQKYVLSAAITAASVISATVTGSSASSEESATGGFRGSRNRNRDADH
jgi:hypothetical protein